MGKDRVSPRVGVRATGLAAAFGTLLRHKVTWRWSLQRHGAVRISHPRREYCEGSQPAGWGRRRRVAGCGGRGAGRAGQLKSPRPRTKPPPGRRMCCGSPPLQRGRWVSRPCRTLGPRFGVLETTRGCGGHWGTAALGAVQTSTAVPGPPLHAPGRNQDRRPAPALPA